MDSVRKHLLVSKDDLGRGKDRESYGRARGRENRGSRKERGSRIGVEANRGAVWGHSNWRGRIRPWLWGL